MRNLHLINDEKITISIIESFQYLNNEDLFVIFTKSSASNNDFSSLSNVVFAEDFRKIDRDVIFDKVFIHFLEINKIVFLESHPIKYKKLVWFLWGGDLYNRPEFGNKTIERDTLKILIKTDPIKEIARKLSNTFRGDIGNMGRVKKFAAKIDVISTTIEKDQQLANEIFGINTVFYPFNFYKIDENYKPEKNLESGGNIIVGNSGTPTNNHISVLNKLKDEDLVGRKIYIPLSYGNKKYANEIIKYGKYFLGDSFVPLQSFMSINEYDKLLGSCDIAIYNFRRQQGFGNVIKMLLDDKKIYLNHRNSMFDFFHNNHIKVNDIDKLNLHFAEKLQPETFTKVYNLFGADKFFKYIKDVLNA